MQLRKTSAWRVARGIALFGVFLSASAQAAVFTVNSPSDGSFGARDANPGDGVCETGPGNGICSLRAAIQETNALAGDDTIILPPDTYQLSTNLDGSLIIAGNLTITGGGASTTTIRGAIESDVLDINSGFTVNLSGVTIVGAGLNGSDISNGGTLILTNSTLRGGQIGGILNSNRGAATLINSTVSENGRGPGGIINIGTLTLINSTVSRNSRGILNRRREKGTGYFFSLPVTIKPGKSPLCREFLEDN